MAEISSCNSDAGAVMVEQLWSNSHGGTLVLEKYW